MNKIKYACVLLIFFNYTITCITTSAKQNTPYTDPYESLLLTSTQQLEKINYLIESVIEDIRIGSVHLLDKNYTCTQLVMLHRHISTLLQTKHLQSDHTNVTANIDTLQQLIENLQAGIDNNFNEWQAIIPQKRGADPKKLEQLQSALNACVTQTEHLAKQLQQVGLNRFRKTYRLALHAIERHKTASTLLGTGITACIICTCIWGAYRHIPYLDRDGKPILDKHNNPLRFKDMPRGVQLAELMRISGLIPQLTLIPWVLWSESIQEKIGQIRKTILKKCLQLHYYAKGSPMPYDIHKTYPTSGFEEVRGQIFNKREALKLIQCVADYERFAQKNIAFQRGLLLLGKTRSGKTFFAEKLCGELNKLRIDLGLSPCPFIQVDAGSMRTLSRFGNGLSAYIEFARNEAPCVLFIDELHSFLHNDPKMLTELLTGMNSAFNNNERPVIIIAATNHPEELDLSLRQKGRFGTELTFEYPYFNERKEHIHTLLKTAFLELDDTHLNTLAHETEGCSYEDLNDVIAYVKQEATINKTPINPELLNQALDAIVRKIKTPEAPLNPDAKSIAAIHHASTIVAIARTNPHKIISKATLLPVEIRANNSIKTQLGAVFCYNTYDNDGITPPAMQITRCKELLAGHAGEKIFYGASAYAFREDNDAALEICKQLTSQGISYQYLSAQLQDDFTTAAIKQKNKFENEIRTLLAREKSTISRIAQELTQHLTLSKEQIAALLIPSTDQPNQVAFDNAHPQTTLASTRAICEERALDQQNLPEAPTH